MFTKSAVNGILAITTLTASAMVSATTFNFAEIANGDDTYGVAGGEYGAESITFTKEGLSVTATGSATGSDATYNAYLDSSWTYTGGGGNGGLGVCKILDSGDQCNPGSDDNVTINENLMLAFDHEVTITDIFFRNGVHNPTFAEDAEFTLIRDGGLVENYPLINLFTMDLTGTTFEFMNLNATDTDDYRFYISTLDATVVPVPAAAWLFGSGLVGLIGMARRKKA